MRKGTTRDFIVARVVTKLTELIQNEVAWVFCHLVACVIDLFDIALGTCGTHDVRRIAHPLIEPVEAFL